MIRFENFEQQPKLVHEDEQKCIEWNNRVLFGEIQYSNLRINNDLSGGRGTQFFLWFLVGYQLKKTIIMYNFNNYCSKLYSNFKISFLYKWKIILLLEAIITFWFKTNHIIQ